MMRELTVYEAFFREKFCGWALSYESAVSLVESSHRFGDPSLDEDGFCLGNTWASAGSTDGWHIVTKSVLANEIHTTVMGSPGETCHYLWTCPQCGREDTEDVYDSTLAIVAAGIHAGELTCCTCDTDDRRQYSLILLSKLSTSKNNDNEI